MSLDRVIRWKSRKPSKSEILCVLEDYSKGLAIKLDWEGGRWNILLPGTYSHPMRRMTGITEARKTSIEETTKDKRERWLEIFPHKDCLYVMTRDADPITNAIAQGLAEFFALFFKGSLGE